MPYYRFVTFRIEPPARIAAHPPALHAWTFAQRLVARGMVLRLPQVAGGLAYLSLFAFVPVTTLALALLTALPAFGRLREALQSFLANNLFPATFSDTVVQYVNQFASQAGGLSALGLAIFLATAITSLFTIEQTLNAIWQAEPRRSLLSRFGLYWMMLTLAPPLLGGSIAMESYFWTLSKQFGVGLGGMQRLSAAVLPLLMTVAVLTLLYRLLPGERVRWKHALIGAAVGGVALQAWKAALGIFVSQFKTYTVVYGAFAVLPALLSWLYVLWLMVLVGALIASEARFWARPAKEEIAAPTPAQRFDLARRALEAMARTHAREGAGAVPASELEALFEGHPERARMTADLLESAGYIRRLILPESADDITGDAADDEYWVLMRDPAQASLRALRDAVWCGKFAERDAEAPDAPGAPHESELDVPLSQALTSSSRTPSVQAARGGA